jgi:ABC-type sugar transport system permease subunit
MIRITEKAAFSTLIFAFAALILYLTFELRTDVGLVPRSVAILLLVCAALQMLIDLFPGLKNRLTFLAGSAKGSLGGEGVVQEQAEDSNELFTKCLFFGWIALFIVLINLTSMIVAAPISLFVYLKFINKESWRMALIYPLAMAAFIYLVFVLGFRLNYFV